MKDFMKELDLLLRKKFPEEIALGIYHKFQNVLLDYLKTLPKKTSPIRTPLRTPLKTPLKASSTKKTLKAPEGIGTKPSRLSIPKVPLLCEQSKKEKALDTERELFAKNPHPRYARTHPLERDFEFAYAFTEVMNFWYGRDYHRSLMTTDLFLSPKYARKRMQFHKGRQRADSLGARYDSYLKGVCYGHDQCSEALHRYQPRPVIQNLGGELQADWYKVYVLEKLNGTLLISREDIQAGGQPELLPENFTGDKDDPVYLRQCTLYDLILEDCIRIHRQSRGVYEFAQCVSRAIEERLIPQTWAEGYPHFTKDPLLKSYKFAPSHIKLAGDYEFERMLEERWRTRRPTCHDIF